MDGVYLKSGWWLMYTKAVSIINELNWIDAITCRIPLASECTSCTSSWWLGKVFVFKWASLMFAKLHFAPSAEWKESRGTLKCLLKQKVLQQQPEDIEEGDVCGITWWISRNAQLVTISIIIYTNILFVRITLPPPPRIHPQSTPPP